MKTILVTGATSGIGKAFALHAASAGYHVIACGRNEDTLAELSKNSKITTAQFDSPDLAATKSAIAELSFDIAVLNAGNCEYVNIDDFQPEMFRRVFEINFFGIIHSVDALLPKLKAGDQLVIVDSMARLVPFIRTEAYGASKAAVHYFTKSLEVDLAHKGILVQSVSPGFVETPLTDKNDFDMPMKITADEAAKALLEGIEKHKHSLFFPMGFGWIMRTLHNLPTGIQRWLSLKMRQQQ